jgi:transcription factor IIIB subunit 2
MVPCKACGGVTISETELGSSVCTDCGTLVNAEQVILAGDLEPAEFGTGQRVHATGSALKSIRTPGWTLAGQGTSDIRDGRNKVSP